MLVRRATAGDDLLPFLVAAFDWRGDGAWDEARAMADPRVAHYAVGWMRPGDDGVVAVEAGVAVGAAWWRTFTADDAGYGHVADDVPELSLAVLPPWRGRGVAGLMLDSLIDLAREQGLRRLSLSVEDGNDVARAMYERRGFVVVGREGHADTLLLAP